MADPLSISASIAGLISIADIIARRSFKYGKGVKNAKKEVAKLITEVTHLFGVLNHLKLVACRYEDEQFESTMQIHHIQSCYDLLEKIKFRLDEADPSSGGSVKKALQKQLTWPFSNPETLELIDEVERHKGILSLALSADGMSALITALARQKNHGEAIMEMREELVRQRKATLDKGRRKILNSFGTIDPGQYQQKFIKLRQPGTGIWFTDGSEFKQWMGSRNGKLWLCGIAGAGKTILTSSVIQETQKTEYEDNGLAYFYCDYNVSSTLDPMIILGSLIRQFAMQHEPCFEELETFYKANNPPGKPPVLLTPKALCSLIQKMAVFFEDALIIVDGLDECEQDQSSIVELLAGLNVAGENNVKTLFVSRPEVDLEKHLSDYTKVSIAARSSDLKLYVRSEIEERIRTRKLRLRDPNLREQVTERLTEGADGMFRWVVCQIDYLCKLRNDGACRKALYSLPPTLYGTYERILERVNASSEENRILVEKVLKWILCAREPLSIDALLEAISINERNIRMDRDIITDEEEILHWCSSLIRRTADSKGVELAHFTVKEFLLAIDLKQKSSFARYHVQPDGDDVELAILCLKYLSFEDFRAGQSNSGDIQELLGNFHLYRYAALYWDEHAYNHFDNDALTLLVRTFFAPSKTHQFVLWTRFLAWERGIVRKISDTTTLHCASSLALPEISDWLLQEGCEVNKMSELGNPLHCALLGTFSGDINWLEDLSASEYAKRRQSGKIKTMNNLLSAGATVNTKPFRYHDYSLLYVSMQMGGDSETIKLLLEAGAVLDARSIKWVEDNGAFSVISSATGKNLCDEIRPKYIELALEFDETRERTLKLVLEEAKQKKLSSAQAIDYNSILREAARHGQTHELAELLLRPDVDLNSEESFSGATALHLCSDSGHLGAVKLLIEHGADLHLKDDYGETALHCCSESGHLGAVKLLIEHGADLHLKNDNGETALYLAASSGHLIILKYLESKGAIMDEKSGTGHTVLHIASMGSDVEVLQYLLDSNPESLTLRSEDGRTPLMCAARLGSLEVAQFLLEKSNASDILMKSNDGRTCLHFAAQSREASKVKLFLDSAISIDDQTDDGSTALHLAANNSYYDETAENFVLLLENGAQHSIPTNEGNLPIHHICRKSANDSCERLEALLQIEDKRATYVNSTSNSGATPLQLVISQRPFDHHNARMTALLSSCTEININCLDDKSRSPLILLAQRFATDAENDDMLDAIRNLLQKGANMNQRCRDGRTALHYLFTADITHVVLVAIRLLFEHTTELAIKDANGQTVIDLAFQIWQDRRVHDAHFQDATETMHQMVKRMSPSQVNNHLTNGMLPLTVAVQARNELLIEKLLDRNADVDKETRQAYRKTGLQMACIYNCEPATAERFISRSKKLFDQYGGDGLLHIACLNGNDELARQLLLAHLDIEARNVNGSTPLFKAVEEGHLSTTEWLLENGANVSAKDNFGMNVTHVAAIRGSENLCEILLRTEVNWTDGASYELDGRRCQSVTPLHLAACFNNIPVVKFLLDNKLANDINAGADLDDTITPLHLASWRAGVSMVELLLSNGASVHAVDRYSSTPLHWASSRPEVSIAELLLSNGANVHAVDCNSSTPLHLASLHAGVSMVELLLSNGASVHAVDRNSSTPLHWAADRHDSSEAKNVTLALLEKGADGEKVDSDGLTPVSRAFDRGSMEVESILQEDRKKKANHESAKPSTDDPTQSHTSTRNGAISASKPLLSAVRIGDLEVLKRLVREGVSTNGTAECGCTPLVLSCLYCHWTLCHFLVENGADLHGQTCDSKHRTTAGWRAVHYAAYKGKDELLRILPGTDVPLFHGNAKTFPFHLAAFNDHVICLKLLLDQESSTSHPRRLLDVLVHFGSGNPVQGTALHVASARGSTSALSFLIKEGANIDAVDTSNRTPLHVAVSLSQIDAVEILLAEGANVNCRDKEGGTLMHSAANDRFLASAQGRTSALSILTKGANIEAVDNSNRTPLHVAVFSSQIDAVKMLLAAGANANCRDENGETPMHYAADNGDLDILLLLHQSDITARDVFGSQPIHSAALRPNTISIVQHLIDRGVDLQSSDGLGYSPLHHMVTNGSQEMQEIAMKHIDDPYTSRHPLEGTTLNAACYCGKLFTVKALLKRFPEENAAQYVDHRSSFGTPLYSAASRGNLEIMEALIDAGASLDLIGGEYGPPLHAACVMGRVEATRFLLDRGAKIDYVGEDGKVILAMDAAVHHKHVQALLRSWRTVD